ncbi:MAG: DUF2079 domain-containing protein, partial [Verrucomicrobia bacterium]|nr:DUF2079 domain-containing protein [Verrucomicrobiota bacterium]
MKYLVLAFAYIIGVVAERRLDRAWVSRAAGAVFYALTGAALIALGVREYTMLGFQGDGVHYYSALRNLLAGNGLYEGPTFEHLLGNHSYVTLLAVAPLVAVFQSPVVLLVLTILSHLVSAVLVHRLAIRLVVPGDQNRLLPLVMGVLYLLYPTVFGLLFGRQLFQPDYLLAPLLLLLVHALADGRTHRASACIALIVLTKEEYIVTLPVMLVWALAGLGWVLGHRDLLSRRRLLEWVAVYVVSTVAAVVILVEARSMNGLNYAVRDVFRIERLLEPASWEFMFQELIVWIAPLVPLLVLIAA